MITRPSGLEISKVDLVFNFQNFEYIEIDLNHVNKGGRSQLVKENVAMIVTSLINETALAPSDEKVFGDDICSYFVKKGNFESKIYKLVFCICCDRPTSIGVITLHRV